MSLIFPSPHGVCASQLTLKKRSEKARKRGSKLLFALLALLTPRSLMGYGVLSHEELIDISWVSDIRPALLKHYPDPTPEQIKEAHAYAYGGSVVQDLGYYPFGSHDFTNLLHYVRSGAFVAWMLRDARNVNEYAFHFAGVRNVTAVD